jgi:hypothetical protein
MNSSNNNQDSGRDVEILASVTPFDSRDIGRTSVFASGKMFIESSPLEAAAPLTEG